MVTGPFINAAAVLIGGIAGAGLSHRLPERIRTSMPSVFGLASLAIGVLLIIKCANMPVMVLSVLLGAVIGELCCLENKINAVAGKIKTRLPARGGAQESFIENYVVLIFLFCVSGTGIFGAMHEGMTGDPTVLLTKAFMDFFYRDDICLLTGYCGVGYCRTDADYSAGTGGQRRVINAVYHTGHDGGLYRSGRGIINRDRASDLRY